MPDNRLSADESQDHGGQGGRALTPSLSETCPSSSSIATIPLAVPVAFAGCSPKDANLASLGREQHGHHRSVTAEAAAIAAAKAAAATTAGSSVTAGGRHLVAGAD